MIKIIQDSSLSHNKIQTSPIHKWDNNDFRQVDDFIATESPLEIRLGHQPEKFHTLAVTMCSPADIKDLVTGYLLTENIINNLKDLQKIEVFDNEIGLITEVLISEDIDIQPYLNKRQGAVHASCGICGKTDFDDLLVFNYANLKPSTHNLSSEVICSLPRKLKQAQLAYKKTGGLHASALFDKNGNIILMREDVGRHNALDKLIGAALKQWLLPLNDSTILLSGRVSFELVHKSLMAGAMTLCAIGAPSSLSIETAQSNGMNLIGFIQASGYNHYTSTTHNP